MKTIGDIIRARLEEIGDNQATAARRGKLAHSYLNNLIKDQNPNRSINAAKIPAVAQALKWSIEELTKKISERERENRHDDTMETGPEKDLPKRSPADPQSDGWINIIGIAHGSVISSTPVKTPIGRKRAFGPLLEIPGLYAVYVAGESMSPQHLPGDLRLVDPNQPPKVGDSVIAWARYNGETRMMIKRLGRSDDPNFILLCGPEGMESRGQTKEPAENILHLHKVLTFNDLFGV